MERQQKDNLQKVKILRNQLCIGFQEGLDLLKQTDGNLEEAAAIYKEKILGATIDVVKLPADKVQSYLEKYKYDAGRAIDDMLDEYRLVDGVPSSEPVYILHKYQSYKKEAVVKIAVRVMMKEDLSKRLKTHLAEFAWLTEEDLQGINSYALRLLSISEWLDYEDSETFEDALFYNLDLVTEQIKLIGLNEMAAAIRMARDIYQEYIDIHTEGTEAFFRALRKDTDYRHAKKYFEANRSRLFDALYIFIQDNLENLNL